MFFLSVPRKALAGLSILLLASCSGSTPQHADRRVPAPTELAAPAEGETGVRRAREIWEERLHRTPPGVSWRAIEIENRRRNLMARNTLLQTRAAVDLPGTWRERGSFNQTGRTHVTTVGRDGKTLFIGTDRGGVFSGLPGGRRWVPRSDSLGIGVLWFEIVPGNPEVWIAAGQGGPLYVSTNAGATWAPARGGPAGPGGVVRVHRDRSRPRTVFALEGPVEGRFKLYRSDNGGLAFRVVASGPSSGIADLWIDRVHGGPLYLAVGQEIRKSTDGGLTFQRVGRLPIPVQDIFLAGSEAGAPALYAAVWSPTRSSVLQLYASEDGGRSWKVRSTLEDFWGVLTASITNPRLVFVGGLEAHRSIDAGRTFQRINQGGEYYASPDTKMHFDLMGIDCAIYRGKEAVFFNTDGGTFLSENGGRTVRNITRYGLGNGQYYNILTSVRDSRRIAAGSQDQGYQISRPSARALLGFDQIVAGDYGSLTSSDGTHDMLYAAHPFFMFVQFREGLPDYYAFPFPQPLDERRNGWIPPLVADPGDPEAVYYADRWIWRMRRAETGWASEMLPHDFGPAGDSVTAFAISPADSSRWYAGTANGRLWHSRDGGRTWASGGVLDFLFVSDVLPSPTDPDACYVAGSGYYDGTPVYRTLDGGATWEPHAQGLPRTLVRALAFDDPSRQTLYAATDAGPFRYDEASGAWSNILGTQAPLTTYMDVEGVPVEGVVRFATYGRGIWDFSPR